MKVNKDEGQPLRVVINKSADEEEKHIREKGHHPTTML